MELDYLGTILFLCILVSLIIVIFISLILLYIWSRRRASYVARLGNYYFDNHNRLDALEKLVEKLGEIREEHTMERATKNNNEFTCVEALKEKLPRFSVLYDDKSVDVYSEIRMSQVYFVAKDYFESKDSSPVSNGTSNGINHLGKEPIRVENLKVWPIKQPHSLRERPKSILVKESNINGFAFPSKAQAQAHTAGMYIQKTIGPEGGTISIQGAKLSIPNGAVSVATQFQLGVVSKLEYAPVLEKNQALLSSIVACGPQDVVFHVPAVLEIQHCAKLFKNWEMVVMRSETSLNEVPSWKPLLPEHFVEKINTENSCGLRLKSLSQFAILGSCLQDKASKLIKLVAFAPPVELGQTLTIRIYCVDDYDRQSEDRAEIEDLEDGCRSAHPPQPLYIYNTSDNICIQIEGISSNWRIVDSNKNEIYTQTGIPGGTIEEIDFQSVWHSGRPYCEFHLEPVNKQQPSPELICTIVGFQRDLPNKKSKIKITQREQKPVLVPRTNQVDDNISPIMTQVSVTENVFPYHLRTTLIHMLEPDDRLYGRDWKMLADYLKLPYVQVLWLQEQKGTRQGPVDFLLKQWEHEQRSLDEFTNLMSNMQRYDVEKKIKEFQDLQEIMEIPGKKKMDRIRKTIKGIVRGRSLSTDAAATNSQRPLEYHLSLPINTTKRPKNNYESTKIKK